MLSESDKSHENPHKRIVWISTSVVTATVSDQWTRSLNSILVADPAVPLVKFA